MLFAECVYERRLVSGAVMASVVDGLNGKSGDAVTVVAAMLGVASSNKTIDNSDGAISIVLLCVYAIAAPNAYPAFGHDFCF